MNALIPLVLIGGLFGAVNTLNSRLVNNGTTQRFPWWLISLGVLTMQLTYVYSVRAVTLSSGIDTALAYSGGSIVGVLLGAWFANGPLYYRFHPRGKSG
jgi:fructose-specific phosphotransferase system IIC component